MLQNANFDGEYTEREAPEVRVATGWGAWATLTDPTDVTDGHLEGYNRKPEYKGEVWSERTRSGKSQHLFNSFATHTAGLYQQITHDQLGNPIEAGKTYKFSIWAYVWSSQHGDLNLSREPGNYRLSVGVDPTGGSDPKSSSIAWTEEVVVYDQWIQLSVSAEANAGTITVFTKSRPQWRVANNNSWWDDAELVEISEPTGLEARVIALETFVDELSADHYQLAETLRELEAEFEDLKVIVENCIAQLTRYRRWKWLLDLLGKIFR